MPGPWALTVCLALELVVCFQLFISVSLSNSVILNSRLNWPFVFSGLKRETHAAALPGLNMQFSSLTISPCYGRPKLCCAV